MRAPVSIGLAVCTLSGCVGWTGASQLRSADRDTYASVVDTSPAVFVGPIPGMAYPFTYSVRDCFSKTQTVKDVPGLIFGDDPIDRVCRQYEGIDLRDYPASTADCFAEAPAEPLMEGDRPTPRFRHPWQTSNLSAECSKLIADIRAAGKVH